MSDTRPSPHPRPRPRRDPEPEPPKKGRLSGTVQFPNWLFYIVVLFVLGLWGAALIVSFLTPNFSMPASLNGAVPIVLFGLFGGKAVSDNRKDGGKSE